MADTTRLPEEDKPQIRPDLRAREGMDSNTAGGQSWAGRNSAGSGTGGASQSTRGVSGGATSGTGGNTASYNSPSDLKNAEESPKESDEDDDRVGKGYTSDNYNSTRKGKSRFRITRRRAAIAGVGTTTIVGAILGISSISTGPLEFVHIAQLLDKFHFSSQQDAQDGRLMKIARYIKDPDKPQNTRLGFVGNKVAHNLEAKMKESTGLSSDYDKRSGRFNGYLVDRSHDNFKGMSDEEVKAQLAKQYGIDESTIHGTGDHMTFNPDTGGIHTLRRYQSQTRMARTLLGEAGYSKVTSYVGSRVLGKRAGWTFHPIQELDASIRAKALEKGSDAIDKLKEEARKAKVKYISDGVVAANINSENGSTKDAHGNPTDPGATTVADNANSDNSEGGSTAQDINNGKDTTKDLSNKLSTKAIAGGAAGLAGLLCLAEGLNAQVEQAKFDKAELPMMRMAGDAISTGSQVQSGQDISALQLGFDSDQLTSKDSNGAVTSTWNQAQSIQAVEGQPQAGPDIPKSGQVFGNGGPFDFLTSIPALSQICKALSGPFGIIVSVITGPLSALVSQATAPLVGQATDAAAGWLSGAPVNPLASGADYGNFINYGSRLSANEQYGSAGGVQMDTAAEQQLASVENGLDASAFQSKSIAYRIFNPNDSQTLASHLIDNYGSSSAVQDMATMTHNFGSIFSSALKIPATLLSGVTHAASPPYDWHGLKKVGFRTDQLDDSQFDNPFDNACYVAGGGCSLSTGRTVAAGHGVLDGPNGTDLIGRAEKCFGAKITGDGTITSPWTVDDSQAVKFDNSDYPSGACQSGNLDWMRVRFWLLDTQTIEGYDCYQGGTDSSDQSCTDSGFSSTSSGTTTPTPTSSPTASSAQDLANQLLNSPHISFDSSNPKSSLEAAAQGNPSPAGVDECGVQHPPVKIDSKLLAFLVDLSQVDSFTINSLTTGTHVCDSNHYKGTAVDLGCDVDTAKADSVGQKYGISHNYESCSTNPPHWHYSIGGS